MCLIETARFAVTPEPLSAAAFARFGDVAERPIDVRRRYLPTAQDRSEEAATATLWISSAARLGTLPLQLTTLERHPYTAQTFIPLGSGSYLAIACASAADGTPDLATLRCFIAGAHQSVTFARNVWHHPMTVLGEAMEFAVAMGMTGREDDDVFVSLDADVRVTLPPTA
ncbi:MAG: ureidoglycolate lyase [Tardiphaga sp.]